MVCPRRRYVHAHGERQATPPARRQDAARTPCSTIYAALKSLRSSSSSAVQQNLIQQQINLNGARIVINDAYQQGMGTSLQAGVSAAVDSSFRRGLDRAG